MSDDVRLIRDSAVLVTGGSGFLGRALLHRAVREGWDNRITIYSRDEAKHIELSRYLQRTAPLLRARFVLGDIRDTDRLEAACVGHDLVIHAGALKHIPAAEFNVAECIAVNLIGSQSVAQAAARAGVARVIGLSTDKAAAPLNTYGMTKALMERVFAEANGLGDTLFACVRYGNVISSSGSVIPEFQRQAREDGAVRVTDERMSRFWLSHDDALDLIEYAQMNVAEHPGAVFIPRCAAMRIMDIARAVVPGAKIRMTGLRPGEKLHETLIRWEESPRVVQRAPCFILAPATEPGSDVAPFEYVSSDPDRRIEADELLAMVAAAAEV